MNAQQTPSALDRKLAGVCIRCLVCRRARRRPGGFAATLVRSVESRICPFCRAYERVFGRAAHLPTADDPSPPPSA